MNDMRGASADQLQTLANVFLSQKGVVEELKTKITNALTNTAWQGPQADRFREEWNNEFSAGLRKLQEALEHNANVVKTARAKIIDFSR